MAIGHHGRCRVGPCICTEARHGDRPTTCASRAVAVIRDGSDNGLAHSARSRSRPLKPELPRNTADGVALEERAAVAERIIRNRTISIAVCDEHEVLQAGLVALLAEDRALAVKVAAPEQIVDHEIDVAVVSREAARSASFPCPIVIVTDQPEAPFGAVGNDVLGVLNRRSLTASQLRATVHAAAAGLRIQTQPGDGAQAPLDARSLRVLELIADGCSTREIATSMSYSERTIKKLINELQDHMQARTRAQAVAHAMRRGLI